MLHSKAVILPYEARSAYVLLFAIVCRLSVCLFKNLKGKFVKYWVEQEYGGIGKNHVFCL